MFILYKTTNKINNKFYIGVHNGTRSWYRGSGSILKKAIKKYGIKNFHREILYEFKNETDAYLKEEEILTLDLISNPLCYNLRLGGKGGRSGVVTAKDRLTDELIGSVSNQHPKWLSGEWVHVLKGRDTFKNARIISAKVRRGKPSPRRGIKETPEQIENKRARMLGRKQSEATKLKRSLSHKDKPKPKLICPYCKKEGGYPSMKRWHFENCKQSSCL